MGELVDRLLGDLRKQPDPWQRYQGDRGGQGWLNVQTGEIRYQEEKPQPREGATDPSAEQEGTAEPPGDAEADAPDPVELLEPGEGVFVDSEEYTGPAEVVDAEGDDVGLTTPGGDDLVVDASVVDPHDPRQAPAGGFAAGWQAPPPHDQAGSLEPGQRVELYDADADAYVAGEVKMTEQDDPEFNGDYLAVDVPDQDLPVEIAPGVETNQDVVLTAVEAPGERVAWDELAPGDTVVVDDDNVDTPFDTPTEATVVDPDKSKGLAAHIDHGDETYAVTEAHHGDQVSLYAPEDGVRPSLGEVPGIDVDVLADPSADERDAMLDVLAGATVAGGHPVADGEVEGTVEVTEDSQGNQWLTVQTLPEEGESFEIDDQLDTAPDEWVGEVVGVVDVEGDVVHVEFDDGAVEPLFADDLLEEASFALDPDHPLFVGDAIDSVQSPWDQLDDAVDVDEFKTGDSVLVDGEIKTVQGVIDDDYQATVGFQDGTQLEAGELDRVDAASLHDPIEPPDDFDWEPAVEVDDAGDVSFPPVNPADTVYYFDEAAGTMEVAEAAEQSSDGTIELANGATVERTRVEGVASTGKPPLPEASTTPDMLDMGDGVEVAFYDNTGEVHTFEGMMAGFDDTHGEYKFIDVETGRAKHLSEREFERGDAVVASDSSSVDVDLQSDWRSEAGEVVADRIADRIDIERVKGAVPRGDLLVELMRHHPPEGVQNFHWALGDENKNHGASAPWKSDSGTHEAARFENAFDQALGISMKTRGAAQPGEAMVATAKTVHELSKRRFEAERDDLGGLYRGLSDPGSAGLLANWLTNPFDDAAAQPGFSAINNFTTHQRKAENLGGSGGATFVVGRDASEIDPEAIAAYHDAFFTGPNDNEGEISVRGDKAPDFVGDEIYWAGDVEVDFSTPPHEWDEPEARQWRDILEQYGTAVLTRHNPHGQPTRNQLENLARIERVMRQQGVQTRHVDVFQEARERLQQEGRDPETIPYPELADDPVTSLPDHVESVDDYREGMEVTFQSPHGEVRDGDIVSVEEATGDVEVADYVTGEIHLVEPEAISSIDYASEPYGPLADDLGEADPASFQPAEQVHLWYGDWEEAMVTAVDEDAQQVKVSRENGMIDTFSFDEARERMVPQDRDVGGAAEGSDGINPGDVDEGDELVLDNTGDVPAGSDEHIDERPVTVGEITEHSGQPLFVLEDDNGVVYDELYADELADLAEPAGGSDGGAAEIDGTLVGAGDVVELSPATSDVSTEYEVTGVDDGTPQLEHLNSGNEFDGLPDVGEDLELVGHDPADGSDSGDGASEGSDGPPADVYEPTDFEQGSQVVVDHFEEGETDATVIGYDTDKNQVLVDITPPGEDPAPSQIMLADPKDQILDVTDETAPVSDAAVETASEGLEGFTQYPLVDDASDGSNVAFEVGDPIDPTEYVLHDELAIDGEVGVATYEVVDIPETADGPLELVEQDSGSRFLYWPDGEVESV